MRIEITVDGVVRSFECDGMRPLSDLLRVEFGVQSQVSDCDDGSCGACAVFVDGDLVCSCLTPLVHVDGRRVTTIHGLEADGERLHHAIERAFARCDVTPCDVCFPATVLFMVELLRRSRSRAVVEEADVRSGLGGIGCRCGLHAASVSALLAAVNGELTAERTR